MVHRIKIFLLFTLLTISFNYAHAGAAEKWDYDVKPDQNQKLDVKGHKVDGYGNAANDYEYNRKIDPTTVANRSKMGAVGMGRLLKITGWGLLGTSALQGLLEAIDWVIDPEAQSIWRYKKTVDVGFGCQNFGYKWKVGTNVYNCPVDAFSQFNICKTNSTAKDCKISELWADQYHTVKVSSLSSSSVPDLIDIEVAYTFNGTQDKNYIRVYKDQKIQEQPKEKEELTQEQLADYANRTHPDFADPTLAPKLDPHYTPSIQTDLWKPSNPWEYDNSPTVDEVKKELEQANPEPKDDKIKENEPDPETGAKSFSLPAFCSWATSVCEFIDSFKEEPETPETTEVEIDQTVPVVPNTSYFNWGAYCPFTPGSQTISLENTSAGIDYDLTSWCDLATDIRPFVLAAGALMSFLIAAGIVMGRDD